MNTKIRRFSDEQIIAILKKATPEVRISDICNEHGIAEQTFYRWRSKYWGADMRQLLRLKELETENQRLKQVVAELTLDNWALKAASKKL